MFIESLKNIISYPINLGMNVIWLGKKVTIVLTTKTCILAQRVKSFFLDFFYKKPDDSPVALPPPITADPPPLPPPDSPGVLFKSNNNNKRSSDEETPKPISTSSTEQDFTDLIGSDREKRLSTYEDQTLIVKQEEAQNEIKDLPPEEKKDYWGIFYRKKNL